MTAAQVEAARPGDIDSSYSWFRLLIGLLISTISGVGMWAILVILPVVQVDFGITRAEATLPFTMTMFGFAAGNVVFGRLADRLGIVASLAAGTFSIVVGYLAASVAPSLWPFALAHLLIGLGSAAGFGPLVADISFWFKKRRGVAVSVCASGNYLAGTVWPPLVRIVMENYGWRTTIACIAAICAVTVPPLILFLRRRAQADSSAASQLVATPEQAFGISPNTLQWLMAIMGLGCCVAMSMPQVHIVAYCADLGYGVARGAEMLSVMMGAGIVSRIVSGFIADKIGGLRTLLLGAFLQAVALVLYLFFDGLVSLFVVSALFGLFQGGIVPSYALIVREYYPAHEAGSRVGIAISSTIVGMALGGWLSGAIYDWTGSYQMAFANGIAWNALNLMVAVWLLTRPGVPRLTPKMA